ncbi:hypothetical protein Tco_0785938 [Tanacetum coccineum]
MSFVDPRHRYAVSSLMDMAYRYSLVSKAFRVFNTRRLQTEETFHITFDESTDAIKFSKPLVDNITINESERLKPIANEADASLDQNDQADQNDQRVQNDEILNDDQSEHSNHTNDEILNDNQSEHLNHTNDEHIINNLTNIEDFHNSKPVSSPTKDTLAPNAVSIIQTIAPSSIPSMATLAPQDIWAREKHIELVNIIGNPGTRMLTRAMAKELSAASAHERFESSEFPNHVCKLDKDLYGLKQAPRACENSNGTPYNLGPDLSGKAVNETPYKGMIGSLMYLTVSRPNIQFSTCLCARCQANLKESHLIVVKRIFRYLKGTPSLGLWYKKCSSFDLKGYSDSEYARCNMDRKSTSAKAEYVAVAGCRTNILWMKNQLSDYDIVYEKQKSQQHFKLPKPLLKFRRRIPKAKSLELNLDKGNNFTLQ